RCHPVFRPEVQPRFAFEIGGRALLFARVVVRGIFGLERQAIERGAPFDAGEGSSVPAPEEAVEGDVAAVTIVLLAVAGAAAEEVAERVAETSRRAEPSPADTGTHRHGGCDTLGRDDEFARIGAGAEHVAQAHRHARTPAFLAQELEGEVEAAVGEILGRIARLAP